MVSKCTIHGSNLAQTSTDDFFQAKFAQQDSFPNKVPFMSGMNSTEFCCLVMIMGEEMTPGLNDGWTKDQMIENYKQGGCTVSHHFLDKNIKDNIKNLNNNKLTSTFNLKFHTFNDNELLSNILLRKGTP